jgi:predicted kinase
MNLEDLIVFDATFVSAKKRSKYIKIAKEKEFIPIAIFCKTPEDICRQRNELRSIYRKVPDKTISDMASRLEVPQLNEGFEVVMIFNTMKNLFTFDSKILKQADLTGIKPAKRWQRSNDKWEK